ncbi:UDP-glycosyltransferase 83A1-like [Prosopis cineraria]|uniref:UDP-glycosyltransferase 83A1-like n=1 Tax=Prosopis cineraria TaxID=364024 RepID=UPI00240EBABD|nr:UDP-glycosyltransferase 83A1-like [Prosopis cineraria]
MSKIPHFLVIPFPVLGHVNPLMQFSEVLAKHGCKVTFLNTEFSQKRVMAAAASSSHHHQHSKNNSLIKTVTLPDGLSEDDDRSKPIEFIQSVKSTMPGKLPKLIEDVNNGEGQDSKISCIVVSMNMGGALEVAQKLGIKGAVLFPASATSMASVACVQRLIDDGIIDPETGLPIKNEEIQLSPDMPLMDPAKFAWTTLGKSFFGPMLQEAQTLISLGQWWLCNTTYELEPGALSISPKFLPIGPLLPDEQNSSSSFWQEDQTCLDWLDQQPPRSVIYVSFGSLAVMDPSQFKELALGLDLLDRPFLWVVRPSNTNKPNGSYVFPEGFKGEKGKIINWAPQKKVLNHPSVACFVSHCGWNSTMDGVCSGVPFLCWPFFSDQFEDKEYVCNVWKIGLGFEKDENGVITREEIKEKVEKLIGDEEIRERSLKWKKMVMDNVAEGGRSSDNLKKFINWTKE